MKLLIFCLLITSSSFALSKKEHKKCVKSFLKWEKKRKDKYLNKLKEHKYKCLDNEEFKLEFDRANMESPQTNIKYYSSKFKYFKKKDQQKLKASIDKYFDKVTGFAESFDSLRNKRPKDFWRRWSTCKVILANVEEDKTAMKNNTWKINFQVTDAQFPPLSAVSFYKKVTYNEVIVDTHYKRAMNKARKVVGKILYNCVTRPFY